MLVVPAWADMTCELCGQCIHAGVEFVIVDEDIGVVHEERCYDGIC